MRTGMFGTRLEGSGAAVTGGASSSATGGLAGADQLAVPMFRGFGIRNRMELSVLSTLLGRSRQRHDPGYISAIVARCLAIMRPLICRVKA